MLGAMLRTGISQGLNQRYAFRMLSCLPLGCTSTAVSQRGERRTMIRQHRVEPVGDRRDAGAQDVGGQPACRLLLPLGHGTRADAVDGHTERQAACCRMRLGTVEMAVAQRVRLELGLGREGAIDLRQVAYAMALEAAMP